MEDLDLYKVLHDGTKVWFVEDMEKPTRDKCHKGVVIFLGIKKDKTQVELLVGEKEGEGVSIDGEHFRVPSGDVFATFDEMKAFFLVKLNEAKAVIESMISDADKMIKK